MFNNLRLVAFMFFVGSCGSSEPLQSAANEFAHVTQAPVKFKDFSLKLLNSEQELQFSKHIIGKKLVMVVYFAPWCSNWKHEMALVAELYNTYKGHGFEVVGVNVYGSQKEALLGFGADGPPYPVVVESEQRSDITSTTHYEYRKQAGDVRTWGTPWHVFVMPEKVKDKKDLLLKEAFVVNGELIRSDIDAFIRKHLGLAEKKESATSADSKP